MHKHYEDKVAGISEVEEDHGEVLQKIKQLIEIDRKRRISRSHGCNDSSAVSIPLKTSLATTEPSLKRQKM